MPERGGATTSHADEGSPPIPLLKKKKQGAFTYESIIESPPKRLLPPSPQRVVRDGSGFAKGDWEEQEGEGTKASMQVPPLGYKLGRAPPFLPYYKKQGAGEYQLETEGELPQLAAARAAGAELQGGAWDPHHYFHDNDGRLLDHFASSLLEEEAAELSYLDEGTATTSTGLRGGGGRRATAPVQRGTTNRQAREAFDRPLVWVPTSSSTSASTSASTASTSTPFPCLPGPCMFISKAKVASLAGGGTGLWDGQLGYANLLLGSFPVGHGISEGVHRLVKEFIMGPSPAIKRKRGGRMPVYPKGGYWVCCHICGNKRCLNPFHLVWGSEADNKKDEMTTYQRLAKEQGHPEWSIPRERPGRM
jgi:hypothetical protein